MRDFMTNPELWNTVATAVIGGGAASAIILWLAKTWVGERIKRDVEDTYSARQQQRRAEFDRALEERKSEISRELEGWKAGYQKALDENRIRFLKLHEDRVTAIKELYGLLVLAEEAMQVFVSPISLGPRDEKELRNNAHKACNEFSTFFTHNRILFSEANCELIDKIRDLANSAYFDFTVDDDIVATSPQAVGTSDDFIRTQRRTSQKKASESMTREFKTLKKQLESEFRAAMGTTPRPSDAKELK